jgi:hypothetical protein
VIQRLYHHEKQPILTAALVPAVGDWAVAVERAGSVGHLAMPLSPESLSRLAAMPPRRCATPTLTAPPTATSPLLAEVAQIVGRGGWRRQTVGFWAPSGGVGKTTLSVNVAAAPGAALPHRLWQRGRCLRLRRLLD